MQRDTMFRIASMTKPVTVAAAMTLVDEGRLALADPVAKWLPELVRTAGADRHPRRRWTTPSRRERPITVDDLMTHRSGLAYAFSVRRAARAGVREAVAPSGPGRLAGRAGQASAGASARRAADLQPRHRRARHRAVAYRGQAAGRGAVRAHLRAARHARHRLQRRPDRAAARRDDVPTRRRRHAAPRRRWAPRPITRSAVLQRRGGLWSTADDYLRFARMLLGGGALDGVRVLSEESVRLMRTDRLTDAAEAVSVPGNAVSGSAAASA